MGDTGLTDGLFYDVLYIPGLKVHLWLRLSSLGERGFQLLQPLTEHCHEIRHIVAHANDVLLEPTVQDASELQYRWRQGHQLPHQEAVSMQQISHEGLKVPCVEVDLVSGHLGVLQLMPIICRCIIALVGEKIEMRLYDGVIDGPQSLLKVTTSLVKYIDQAIKLRGDALDGRGKRGVLLVLQNRSEPGIISPSHEEKELHDHTHGQD